MRIDNLTKTSKVKEGSFWGRDDMVKKMKDDEKASGMKKFVKIDDKGNHHGVTTSDPEQWKELIAQGYKEDTGYYDESLDEWVQDSPAQGFSGQERNFIEELCLRMDGVSKSPEGLRWMGKSETWDEGNVLSDKGKLTTVMLWAKKNIDDLYHKMGSEFKVYSDGNDEGDSGRGQSDGNQIMQNIINKVGKIGEVEEGKSPHKKGTKKYNAHMAAMHAEGTINEHEIGILGKVARQMEADAHSGDYTAIEELLHNVSEEEMEAYLSDHRSPNEYPDVDEGYKVLPPMDSKYVERDGLEGPFTTLSGKVVYYDPKEGSYYDPDTDMYMSYDEWNAHNSDRSGMSEDKSLELSEFGPAERYIRTGNTITTANSRTGSVSSNLNLGGDKNVRVNNHFNADGSQGQVTATGTVGGMKFKATNQANGAKPAASVNGVKIPLKASKEETEYSDKQIKMAFGILNDPRYRDGNYDGAYATIEKIAKGLARHPSVRNALKRANESVSLTNEEKAELNEIWPYVITQLATKVPPITYAGAGIAVADLATQAIDWIRGKMKNEDVAEDDKDDEANDLKGFDAKTEYALKKLQAKYPHSDNLMSALMSELEKAQMQGKSNDAESSMNDNEHDSRINDVQDKLNSVIAKNNLKENNPIAGEVAANDLSQKATQVIEKAKWRANNKHK